MKVSKNSWHYKAAEWASDHSVGSMTLCKYFWCVVGALAAWALIGGLALWLMFILVPWALIMITLGHIPLLHAWYGADAFAMVSIIIGAILPFIGVGHYRTSGLKERFEETLRQEEPGLLRSYYKAHKEKFCPMMEVVDE